MLATSLKQLLADEDLLRDMLGMLGVTVAQALTARPSSRAPLVLIGNCMQTAFAMVAADLAHRVGVECVECELRHTVIHIVSEGINAANEKGLPRAAL